MMRRIVVFFLAILISGDVLAEGDLKGLAFFNSYAPRRKGEEPRDWRQYAGQVWLTSSTDISETTSSEFTLVTTGTHKAVSGDPTDFFIDLREGYFEKKWTRYKIKMGRIYIPWGKADIYNPTDLLGARDMTLLTPDDQVNRIASDSIVIEHQPERRTVRCMAWQKIKTLRGKNFQCKEKEVSVEKRNWKLTYVWTPIFPKGRYVFDESSLGAGVTMNDEVVPEAKLKNSESAFKWAYEGDGWDMSLMYFKGWQHVPHVSLQSATVGAVVIAPEYHPLAAVGMDFSSNAGDWIVTAEAAQKWTDNKKGEDRDLLPEHAEGVLGIERTFGNFRMKVQTYAKKFAHLNVAKKTANAVLETIVAANARLLGFQKQNQSGYSGFISYDNESSGWRSEISYDYNAVTKDYFGQWVVAKRWGDDLETSIGVTNFDGPPGSNSETLRGLSSYFFETKYWF